LGEKRGGRNVDGEDESKCFPLLGKKKTEKRLGEENPGTAALQTRKNRAKEPTSDPLEHCQNGGRI